MGTINNTDEISFKCVEMYNFFIWNSKLYMKVPEGEWSYGLCMDETKLIEIPYEDEVKRAIVTIYFKEYMCDV